MRKNLEPGLGELLRYVNELVDQGAEDNYREMGIAYRARYTPVLRALKAGAVTVTEIKEQTFLTQGAVSQTVRLLEEDGFISRRALSDGRKSAIELTESGEALVSKLHAHWDATFMAIANLEKEICHPLRQALVATSLALERESFSTRLTKAKAKSWKR